MMMMMSVIIFSFPRRNTEHCMLQFAVSLRRHMVRATCPMDVHGSNRRRLVNPITNVFINNRVGEILSLHEGFVSSDYVVNDANVLLNGISID